MEVLALRILVSGNTAYCSISRRVIPFTVFHLQIRSGSMSELTELQRRLCNFPVVPLRVSIHAC